MGYLVKISDDNIETIKPKSFEKEEIMQEIVKSYPEIIPLEEIDENFDPILIIGREFPLEEAGSIDLLAIDVSGLITIIEFKLERNTDIRKIVAQILEYAANLWEMSYYDLDKKVQDYFNSSRCEIKELKNKTLVQAVKWHFEKTKKESGDRTFSSEEFIKNVSRNLQKGEFRLIIFCDNVDGRTKRSVEYLNNLSNFDFYCVSTDAFEVDGNRFFKSNLITIDRKKSIAGGKRAGKISFDDFLNSIPHEYHEYKEVYKYFNEKMKETNGYYSMGTKGFAFYLQINDKKMRPFCGYPDFIELISEKFFNKYVDKAIVTESAKKDYEEKIKNIRPFKDSFKDSRVYPTYKYNQMKPDELKEYFNFIIEWYKKWFME